MEQVGIFYGSSTGNCETVAMAIKDQLNGAADVYDIALTKPEILEKYRNLILGVSTWGIGDLQDDWEEYLDFLKPMSFENKTIALYGLGDQDTYTDSFADGLGKLYQFFKSKNAKIVGNWPIDGYDFDASKALVGDKFVGLVIDEDIQPELTEKRIKKWVEEISGKFT